LTHQGRSSSSGAGSSLISFFIGASFIDASFLTCVGTEEEPAWPSQMTTLPERAAGAW
jgi:hypothetical protein